MVSSQDSDNVEGRDRMERFRTEGHGYPCLHLSQAYRRPCKSPFLIYAYNTAADVPKCRVPNTVGQMQYLPSVGLRHD
jgi:hypothetical protein